MSLRRRTPLKRKRETPRRNEGRVRQGRVKKKATRKTVEEARHHDRVARVGCLKCRRPAEVHHVMDEGMGKDRRRDHRFVAPLCPEHHRGPQGVHGLGRERQFRDVHGIDLLAWATEAWANRDRPEHPLWRGQVTW